MTPARFKKLMKLLIDQGFQPGLPPSGDYIWLKIFGSLQLPYNDPDFDIKARDILLEVRAAFECEISKLHEILKQVTEEAK